MVVKSKLTVCCSDDERRFPKEQPNAQSCNSTDVKYTMCKAGFTFDNLFVCELSCILQITPFLFLLFMRNVNSVLPVATSSPTHHHVPLHKSTMTSTGKRSENEAEVDPGDLDPCHCDLDLAMRQFDEIRVTSKTSGDKDLANVSPVLEETRDDDAVAAGVPSGSEVRGHQDQPEGAADGDGRSLPTQTGLALAVVAPERALTAETATAA